MLRDRSIADLLAAFSSPDPTPGGGSAAALSSAVGASLLMMVAGLPKTRSGSDEDRAALDGVRLELSAIRDRLADAVDGDTAAYDAVVAAYKLPKATPEQQAARKGAIQQALRGATDVPLEVMRQSTRALEAAAVVARHGYRSASSDIGVAVGLLKAGAAGANLNVGVNLDSVADAAYCDRVRAEADDLTSRAALLAGRADDLVKGDGSP